MTIISMKPQGSGRVSQVFETPRPGISSRETSATYSSEGCTTTARNTSAAAAP